MRTHRRVPRARTVVCAGEVTLIWARGQECGTLEAMRIVVCVKHVPDMQSERRFEGGRLVRGEDDVLNELDENAIEAAFGLHVGDMLHTHDNSHGF